MATEVYLRGGQQLTVQESVDELTAAVERLGPRPIPVTTYPGTRAVVNWANVLYVEERTDLPAP